jgi:hypothetical protein
MTHLATHKVATLSETLLKKRLSNGICRFNEDGQLEKLCSKCKEYWPADTEFFCASGGTSDGLHCQCKACSYAPRDALRIQNKFQDEIL